jgi:hypothetical protein
MEVYQGPKRKRENFPVSDNECKSAKGDTSTGNSFRVWKRKARESPSQPMKQASEEVLVKEREKIVSEENGEHDPKLMGLAEAEEQPRQQP